MLPVVRRQRLHEINIQILLDGRFLAPCVLFVSFFQASQVQPVVKSHRNRLKLYLKYKKKKNLTQKIEFFSLVLSVLCQKTFFLFTFTLVAGGGERGATSGQEYFNQFSILNVSLCVRLCCCSSDPRLDECIPQTDLLMFFCTHTSTKVHMIAPVCLSGSDRKLWFVFFFFFI